MFREIFSFFVICASAPPLHQIISRVGPIWTVCSAERVDYTNSTNPASSNSLQVMFSSWYLTGVTTAGKLHRSERFRKPFFLHSCEPDAPMVTDQSSLSVVRFCQFLSATVGVSTTFPTSGHSFVNKCMDTQNHNASWLNRLIAYRFLIQFHTHVQIFFLNTDTRKQTQVFIWFHNMDTWPWDCSCGPHTLTSNHDTLHSYLGISFQDQNSTSLIFVRSTEYIFPSKGKDSLFRSCAIWYYKRRKNCNIDVYLIFLIEFEKRFIVVWNVGLAPCNSL